MFGRVKNSNYDFDDFPVGTKVKIVSDMVDHSYFFGETGVVVENKDSYLGIKVKYDEPRIYKDGYVQEDFNFNPSDLEFIEKKICPHCKKEISIKERDF